MRRPQIICELEEENSRCGNFNRIFPTEHTTKYDRFFEAKRYVLPL